MKKLLIPFIFSIGLSVCQTYTIGDTIPNFTLPVCANGEGQDSISLYDYYDEFPCGTDYNSILLVWLYSWCPNDSYINDVEEYYNEDNNRIVLGIGDEFGHPYNCEDYPRQFNITFPVLDQSNFDIFSWFGSGSLPFGCVINYDMTLYNVPEYGCGIVYDRPELPSPYNSPHLPELSDQLMNEDETFFLTCEIVNGNDYLNHDIYSSDTNVDAGMINHNSTTLELFIIPNNNWSGECLITTISTDTLCSNIDTMIFHLTVENVNDEPTEPVLFYPTIEDTFYINTDTDETISFIWHPSEDVDSEVNYTTTVTLDYFGDTYSEEYESTDSSVSISGYEWAVLMTNLNLNRWTLEYIVQATDGEYTVESEVGEFVFENISLSTDNELTPLSFRLHQNHPNPFNPVTTLRYDLPEDAVVNITIYDMMGRVVSNLVSSQQRAGYKSVQWNATNNTGQPVSAGLYLYLIEAGEFRQTKKMVLLK